MLWRNKKKAKIKELRAVQEEAAKQLHGQQPHVSRLTSWLSDRKDQNGFGLDFEYTLRSRGTR